MLLFRKCRLTEVKLLSLHVTFTKTLSFILPVPKIVVCGGLANSRRPLSHGVQGRAQRCCFWLMCQVLVGEVPLYVTVSLTNCGQPIQRLST